MNRVSLLMILAALGLSIGAISYTAFNTSKIIACADTKKLFDNFLLKKELEKKLEHDKSMRQKWVDSTGMMITAMIKEYRISKDPELGQLIDNRKETYLKMKEEFEKEQMQQTENFDHQIITQMKQYIKEYGLEKNYQYIISNQDESSLLYSSENKDITKELIEYINLKYKGVSK